MRRFDVFIYWFDDDEDQTDVEASDLDDAARRVWAAWSPTGWTQASIRDPESGAWVYLDLDAESFDAAFTRTQFS